MNVSEPELVAAREAAIDVAGPGARPDAEAVARTWSRVTTAKPSARHWVRLMAPVTAAVAVLAVLTIAIGLRPGPSRSVQIGAAPAAQPTTPTPPTPTGLAAKGQPPNVPASGDVPTVAVTDMGTTVGPVPIDTVVSAMVARSATVTPVTLNPGQVLYGLFEVADRKADGSVTPTVHEWWINPDGWEVLKNMINGQDMGGSGPPTGPASLDAPSRTWLAALPTDPAVLYTQLVQAGAGGKISGEAYVLNQLSQLFRDAGPVLTPALRAALYQVIAHIGGASATEVTVAGRTLYRVHQTSAVFTEDLLLDPATGQVAGERWSADDGAGTLDTIDLWQYAVVSAAGIRP